MPVWGAPFSSITSPPTACDAVVSPSSTSVYISNFFCDTFHLFVFCGVTGGCENLHAGGLLLCGPLARPQYCWEMTPLLKLGPSQQSSRAEVVQFPTDTNKIQQWRILTPDVSKFPTCFFLTSFWNIFQPDPTYLNLFLGWPFLFFQFFYFTQFPTAIFSPLFTELNSMCLFWLSSSHGVTVHDG